jgi:alpha-L-fucosidase
MKLPLGIVLPVACFLSAIPAWAADDEASAAGSTPYRPEWESLKAHKDPEWFRDAKFGIYTHWGPVTVGSEDCPCGGQWYGNEMYSPKSGVFAWHKKHFGDQTRIGYKDLIPKFTAEKFDAEAWADLFARSGAKFAGPVAVHHDNFAMWDSQVTPWNAAKMGPKRDIVGELEKAYKRHGLKFITTFHHGFAWRYFEPAFAFDGTDPRYALLYTEAHKAGAPPSKAFQEQWLAMVNEVVGKYQPDMIWFDFELDAVISPEYQRRMFADYYNWAAKNQRESAVAHKFRHIQKYTGILDFERGREDRLVPYPWLTDTVGADWFNNRATPYRSLDYMVQVLVDIVSKNGCMLLDVSPAADGTVPDQAKMLLLGMGDWLAINGEAIYGTRPWLVYGEGPTKGKGGGFSEGADKSFTAKDIRFTTKGDALYAIALGWPKDGKLCVHSLASDAGKISSVSLLGHEGALTWTQGEQGLEVALPKERPCLHAFVLKVLGTGLTPSLAGKQAVSPAADKSITLLPETAELHGSQVRVEEQHGHAYIAAWDKAEESVSWVLRALGKASYRVEIVYSAASGDSVLDVVIAGRKFPFKAARTKDWFDYGRASLGSVEFPKAGVYEVSLQPRDAANWRPVNIRSITLAPDLPAAAGPFKPDMGSLKQYKCPDWFRDAKFGIWAHWGPETVWMQGDWQKAAKRQGLRFGMTEHLAASWWFYATAKGADKTGPLKSVALRPVAKP